MNHTFEISAMPVSKHKVITRSRTRVQIQKAGSQFWAEGSASMPVSNTQSSPDHELLYRQCSAHTTKPREPVISVIPKFTFHLLPKLKVTKEEKRKRARLQDEVTYYPALACPPPLPTPLSPIPTPTPTPTPGKARQAKALAYACTVSISLLTPAAFRLPVSWPRQTHSFVSLHAAA